MIYFIICGHAQMASGLYSGARLLSGEMEYCTVCDFNEGMSSENLQQQLDDILAHIEISQPVLFLTDILGGTPFRTCALLAGKRGNSEVISGMNIQMLVEAHLERESYAENLPAFVQLLIASTRSGITTLSAQLDVLKTESTHENDGI